MMLLTAGLPTFTTLPLSTDATDGMCSSLIGSPWSVYLPCALKAEPSAVLPTPARFFWCSFCSIFALQVVLLEARGVSGERLHKRFHRPCRPCKWVPSPAEQGFGKILPRRNFPRCGVHGKSKIRWCFAHHICFGPARANAATDNAQKLYLGSSHPKPKGCRK